MLSKAVFSTKSLISVLAAKCFNLAVIFSAVNLLTPWVVIYLAWSWSSFCFSVFCIKLLVSVVWIALTF